MFVICLPGDDVEGILETAAKRTLDSMPNLATVRAEFIAHVRKRGKDV
jgi:hypothetical protein